MTSAAADPAADGALLPPGPAAGAPGGLHATGVRSSLRRVQRALEVQGRKVVRAGGDVSTASCPVHEDQTPSMSVRWEGGKVLLHCFGCEVGVEEITAALGLTVADLFDEPLPPRATTTPGRRVGRSPQQRRAGQRRGRLGPLPRPVGRPAAAAEPDVRHTWEQVATYPYVDGEGRRLLQEVVREECTSCAHGRHKRFRQVFLVDGRRVGRKPAGWQAVLYRLPAVLRAVAQGHPVWLLEGEKDVETAERVGLVATTNTQGGQAFPTALAEVLGGADVRVVLDRDATGWDRGVAVHQALNAVGARVRLLLPAPDAPKSDFTDHVDAGHPVEGLLDVDVAEVAAWSYTTAVLAKHAAVEQALSETQARMLLAEEATKAKEGAKQRAWATRWAQEAEIRCEVVGQRVQDVQAQTRRTGTVWAGEALDVAQQAQQRAVTAARAAHEVVGLALPPRLQLPAPADGPAPASGQDGGTGGPRGPTDGDAPASSGGDGDDGEQPVRAAPYGSVIPGAQVERPTFSVVNGHVVQLDPPGAGRRGRDEGDGDGEPRLRLILSLDVRVLEMEFLEDDTDLFDADAPVLMGRESRAAQAEVNPAAVAELTGVVVAYTQPATQETMQLRVTADQWADGSWLRSLPGPPDFDAKPSGLATVRRAVVAVSGDIRRTHRYRSTGWRRDESGALRFVHAGGAINAQGEHPAPVLLSEAVRRYELPTPCEDAARLREAFWSSSGGAMLEQLPGRVTAPLLGHVWRAGLGPNPWLLTLVGSPGSYKTSLASLAMHHWGELWDRRKPASSMSGNGDTLNGLRIKLHQSKDTCYWADDLAPTKDWVSAQKLLEEFARLVHNGEARSRATRDGTGVLDGTPPRASALATSEVMPRPGSAAQRMLVVPVQADEVDLEVLKRLDAPRPRYHRALLMASMLQWLAGDLAEIKRRCDARGEEYAAVLVARGDSERQAAAVGSTWAGWVAMTDFLVERGALSEQERDEVLARVDQGLVDATDAAADPDLPTTTGGRVRELLAHALESKLAYVEDVRTGDAPPFPMAARLGWRQQEVGLTEQGTKKYRAEARGIRFGYVLHDPVGQEGPPQLIVHSTALEQVLKAAAGTMTDAPQVDRGTAVRALCDEGVLIPEQRTGKTPQYTVKRTLHCQAGLVKRMTVLRLDRLLGDDPGQDPLAVDPAPGGPPSGTRPAEGPDRSASGPDGPEPVAGWVAEEPAAAAPAAASANPTVDESQDTGVAFTAPRTGLTSPQPKETAPMSPLPDATGVPIRFDRADVAHPCQVCGQNATLHQDGAFFHVICWVNSTPDSRRQAAARLSGAAAAPPLAGPPAAPPPAARPATPATLSAPAPAQEDTPPPPVAATPSRAAVASGAAAPRDRGGYVAAVAVVHTDGVWLPDGSRRDLPQPLTHVGHIAALVEQLHLGTQVTKHWAEAGQVWLTAELMDHLGLPTQEIAEADFTQSRDVLRDLTRGTAAVTAAVADGWQLSKPGDSLAAWTRVWRTDRAGGLAAWVALVPAMDPQLPMIADGPGPQMLARRLGLFAREVGAPWVISAAATGLDLMMTLRGPDRDRVFTPHEPVPPAKVATLEQDLTWSRKPTTEERELPYVHAYDRGGSYAAGIASLELGIGVAEHHPDGAPFDPKVPGYWRVVVPDVADWRFPHPLDPRGRRPDRPLWVTTPTLQLAREQGYDPDVLEAWVWPEHGRVLDPWYRRVRDARTALDTDDPDAQAARDLLKVVYTRSIGMLGSEEWMAGRRGYAPAWRHHILAKARTNILRRILRIGEDSGRWPVAVVADTIVYASADPDPVAAWPGQPGDLGRGLGKYKPEASGLLADQEDHLGRDDWRGKRLLAKDWDPAAALAGR